MNTKLHALGCAFIAALALGAGSAFAANYRFETIGTPTGTLAVLLVDAASKQPATNAHVYMIQRQWLAPTKGGASQFLDRRVELKSDGSGAFVYRGKDLRLGATVRLVADIAGSPEIEGRVRVNS